MVPARLLAAQELADAALLADALELAAAARRRPSR